jgi:transposase InsO family protein
MGMAQLVVTAVLVEGRPKSEVARTYGVSRRWVIELVQRFLAEGDAGLVPRSRRPRSSPQRTAQAVEDEIIALHRELDRDGHEAGAATIAAHLQQRHGPDAVPAVSTIWRILSARGFVTPQPHKRPKSSWQRFAAEQPNERWQLDITHYRLADGSEVEILNILDDHSRLCLASTARRIFTAGDVNTVFLAATSEHGDPAGLLSDNGAVFTGAPRRGGRVALELTCHARGIRFTHSRPYHPQTCGKSSVSTKPSRNGSTANPARPPSANSKPCSTTSVATTTPSDPTAPSAGAPRCRPTPPAPKPSRPAPRSTPATTGSATTASTPAASSPCDTTAGCTTSGWAAATPAPASWSWSATYTSVS